MKYVLDACAMLAYLNGEPGAALVASLLADTGNQCYALRHWFQKLEGERTEQTPDTLAAIWNVSRDAALEHADKLCDVGFFEKQGSHDDLSFRVPFLYRPALKMVQGFAE